MTDLTYAEALEQVARAIHASRDGAHDYRKYKSDPRIAEAYRKDAVAAICTIASILAEPTEAMTLAGTGLYPRERDFASWQDWHKQYQAVLAASPLYEVK